MGRRYKIRAAGRRPAALLFSRAAPIFFWTPQTARKGVFVRNSSSPVANRFWRRFGRRKKKSSTFFIKHNPPHTPKKKYHCTTHTGPAHPLSPTKHPPNETQIFGGWLIGWRRVPRPVRTVKKKHGRKTIYPPKNAQTNPTQPQQQNFPTFGATTAGPTQQCHLLRRGSIFREKTPTENYTPNIAFLYFNFSESTFPFSETMFAFFETHISNFRKAYFRPAKSVF